MQRDGPGLVQQISCKKNFIIRPFFIEEEAMKCIQFNDSGTIYSLKVVHGTGVVFEVELDEGQPKMERKTPHMYIFEIYWLTCRASNKKTLHSVVLPLS